MPFTACLCQHTQMCGRGAACTHQTATLEREQFSPSFASTLSRFRQRPFTRSLLPVHKSGTGDTAQAGDRHPGRGGPSACSPAASQSRSRPTRALTARWPSLPRAHEPLRPWRRLPTQRGRGMAEPAPSPRLTGTPYRRGGGRAASSSPPERRLQWRQRRRPLPSSPRSGPSSGAGTSISRGGRSPRVAPR